MNSKMKMLVVVIAALGIISLALVASPAMASANGTVYGDKDQRRLRTRDQICNCDMLQTQERIRPRTRDQDGTCFNDCECAQNMEAAQVSAQFGNCSGNMEQHRNQYRNQITQTRGNQ
ncbi:MAG: hypothetical protein QXX08_02350 [Candidatus Bathyarchaeia archaeon]